MSPDQASLRIAFQVPHWPSVIARLLGTLQAIDLAYLRRHPETPPLYQARVVYQREPAGHEEWRAVPQVLHDGFGDCEDLACWRAAELQQRGVAAQAFASFKERTDDNGKSHRLYHIRVRYKRPDPKAPGGFRLVVEDPSRRLGMGDDEVDLQGIRGR